MSCSTFIDDYRVTDADRVGEVNGGWKVISESLAHELVNVANTAATVLRMLDDVLVVIRNDPDAAARALVNASVRATAVAGGGARLEAPMAKVLSTPLLEEFSVSPIRMLGPTEALGETVRQVDHDLRLSTKQVVSGRAVDLQRNLIARALGMPGS